MIKNIRKRPDKNKAKALSQCDKKNSPAVCMYQPTQRNLIIVVIHSSRGYIKIGIWMILQQPNVTRARKITDTISKSRHATPSAPTVHTAMRIRNFLL